MPSETEALALHLVRALHTATAGRPMQWHSLAEISDAAATADAVQFAINKGWVIVNGHSICLTEIGHRMVGLATRR
jgi:hypothetical protein